MAYAVPDFYRAATMWRYTRCAECDGRGYFRSGHGPRYTCQRCNGEGTVPVPAFRFYPPIPIRKPKTMADPRLSAICPCCHGRGHLIVHAPCAHCEETGTVQAEVSEPDPNFPPILREIAKGYANLFTQTDPSPEPGHHPHNQRQPKPRSSRSNPTAEVRRKAVVAEGRVRYEPLDLAMPAPSAKPRAPRSRKSSKRSHPRTRNARNERNCQLRKPRNA